MAAGRPAAWQGPRCAPHSRTDSGVSASGPLEVSPPRAEAEEGRMVLCGISGSSRRAMLVELGGRGSVVGAL